MDEKRSSNKLLISGGRLRKGGFELGDGKYYCRAVLAELDLSNGEFKEVFSLSEGGKHYPSEHPNLQFTAGCIKDTSLYLPTDTEIHELELSSYRSLRVISHPCFQNIHSVHRIGSQLIATSTGLDNIVFMDAATGKIENIINAGGNDPWHRFDNTVDYRLVHSTRPHDQHPNFVFELEGDLWVTRCGPEDAINLSDFRQRIDITRNNGTSVHDGIIWNDKLVFTRVDGTLPIFDAQTRKFLYNLDPFNGKSNRPIGWCRGLYIDDNDIMYIGFSKIRKTRTMSKLKYLAQRNLKFSSGNDALIVSYDLRKKALLNMYEAHGSLIDAIYGVLPTLV